MNRQSMAGSTSAGVKISFATELGLAVRQLRREFRLPEYLVLAFALVLSVAAVTSVGFFANRVERAMAVQAATLLAADATVRSPQAISENLRQRALDGGLSIADVIEFPSVILNDDEDTALVSVKAVSNDYPLRGEVLLSDKLYAAERSAAAAPARGEVWIDPRLAGSLTLEAGDTISLGELTFSIAAFISFEPDRTGDVFQLAPRLIMSVDDLEPSGLLGEGSRARYKLLVAGEEQDVSAYGDWIADRDDAGALRFETVEQGRPAVQSALVNVRRFLGLAAAVAVLLSGAAVALSARQIAERDMDTSAVLRAFGAKSSSVLRIVLCRLAIIAAVAAVAGSLLGYLAQFGLSALLSKWFATQLPAPSLVPLAGGVGCAVLALAGFCLPSVSKAVSAPVVGVLRRDLPAARPSSWWLLGSGVLAMLALLSWLTRDIKLGFVLVAGLLTVVGLLWLLSRGFIFLAQRVQSPFWRRALEGLKRRPNSVSLQISAFSVGLLALLLLAIIRTDVLNAWQSQVPDDAPNFFMVNIQPHEVPAVASFMQARGISDQVLYPMIRGRLQTINGTPIGEGGYADERARRMSERDFNLSYQAEPRQTNEVIDGEWWPVDTDQSYFSVEEEFAEETGIALGDTLQFRVADKEISGVVSNLREVEWESFAVNFFVVGTPALLIDMPASFVTSVHVRDDQAEFVADVVREFPGVTVLEIGTMIERVTGILDRAALAVQYVFMFTLAAGLLVLVAAVLASRRERFHEAAILRTLGASRNYLASSMAREFIFIGLLSGLIASTIASVLAYVIIENIMSLDFQFNPGLWLIGVVAGVVCIWGAGYLASRPVLRQSPLAVIRSQA